MPPQERAVRQAIGLVPAACRGPALEDDYRTHGRHKPDRASRTQLPFAEGKMTDAYAALAKAFARSRSRVRQLSGPAR